MLLFQAGFCQAQSVTLPLTLDYALLRDLIVQEIFTQPDHSILLTDNGDDCSHVRISNPRFSAKGDLLRLEVDLALQAGSRVAGKCFPPLRWEGRLALDQRPQINSQTLSMRFIPVRSHLLGKDGETVVIADMLWSFARPRIHTELSRFSIDLGPPLSEVQGFLEPFLHPSWLNNSRRLLETMQPGKIKVTTESLSVGLSVVLPESPPVDAVEKGVPPLSPEEKRRLVELWESWDILLVRLIEQLGGEGITEEDRQVLIDVLLESRYGFRTMLDRGKLGDPFVRGQFVRAWNRLSPVFRRQLYGKGASPALGYLAFFTAADGLAAFDRLGPAFGVEISLDGLLRLARMLDVAGEPFRYSPDLDYKLRNLVFPGQGKEKKTGSPSQYEPSHEKRGSEGPLSQVLRFLVEPVAAEPLPGFKDILRWKVPDEGIVQYLLRVRTLLQEEVENTTAEGGVPSKIKTMFRQMIDAMAWQESCFRQFTVRDNKLTFLLSSNQTSVGMMQVNERVWRGVYRRDRLRWDIRYNARAGCEIAKLYLNRYVLPGLKGRSKGKEDLLAGAVYALYNGGPGQLSKYLTRTSRGTLYRSDKLFAEKLRWVKRKDWKKITVCLGG